MGSTESLRLEGMANVSWRETSQCAKSKNQGVKLLCVSCIGQETSQLSRTACSSTAALAIHKLLTPQGRHRVHSGCPARGGETAQERHRYERHRRGNECDRIVRAEAEQKRLCGPHQRQG